VVHEALHMALGRRVAVKTLLAETGTDPDLTARFEREARAASAIGHPHIVDVFDLGRTPEGVLFMAMELLDGKPLATLLKETPCLPIPLALDLSSQLLSGLAAAHRNGIVHRDLKPENIFIINTEDRPNFLKIVDFGISKILVRPGHGQRTSGQGTGTAVGTVLGTPLYMSPEQILGQVARIDHRTDIYSAGVVLYEMLCGRTPFEGESHAKIFASILDGWHPLPHDLRRDIPANVDAAIVRALDRDMEKRFASAADMREAVLGRSAEVTPPPELVSAPLALKPATVRPPSSVQRGDPFAPPSDEVSIAFLPRDLENPLAEPSHAASPAIALARPARTSLPAMPRRTFSQETAPSARWWRRLALALGLIAVIVGARVVSIYLRPSTASVPPVARQAQHKVTLAVDPSEAVVQIDQLPTMRDDLFLDASKVHLLHATAPGRITRRFSFEAKADLELSVHLGRSLPLPSSADPGPSTREPMGEWAHVPANPASRDEINHAYGKLERYARCLALLGYADGEARKGGNPAGPSNSNMSGCIQLVDEASTLAPVMFQLHTAAVAYLQSVHSGQSFGTLSRLLLSFRAEFLAERSNWQLEELSRQEKDEGQTAAWHMRRVSLAAQAWLRQSKAGLASRGAKESWAKLSEAHQALLEFTRHSPKEMAQIEGADAFVKAAQDMVALVQGESGKRSEVAPALAACRQLLTAFNSLVVE